MNHEGVLVELGDTVLSETFRKALPHELKKATPVTLGPPLAGVRLELDGATAPCLLSYATGEISPEFNEEQVLAEVRRVARELAAYVSGIATTTTDGGISRLAQTIGVLVGPAIISTDGKVLRPAEGGQESWQFSVRFFYGLFDWKTLIPFETVQIPKAGMIPIGGT